MFGYVCQARCCPSSLHLNFIHASPSFLPFFHPSLFPSFIHPTMIYSPYPFMLSMYSTVSSLHSTVFTLCWLVGHHHLVRLDHKVSDQPRHFPRHKASGNWVAVKVLRKRNVIKYKQVRP